MDFISLLWQVFAFIFMTSFEIMTWVVDEVVFTMEDNDVYGKSVKIFSFCIENFYLWQALATIGFYRYLRRLADNFPADSVATIDNSPVLVGSSMEQLLEETRTALIAALSRSDNLDRENAGLRAKVDRLQTEMDYVTNDRYAVVRENLILQNRLGDFNSWPEFRIGYDQLTAEYVAMKSQREKEHAVQEQTRLIAEERKVELVAAKRAEAKIKKDHREELEQIQRERDEAKEKYQTLLATSASTATATTTATTTTATTTTTPAVTAAAAAATASTIPAVKGNIPGKINFQEESARLTHLLRSQRPLISNLASDLARLQSDLRSRSKHSAFKLNMASLTISALEREKAEAEECIEKLKRDVQAANAKTEEWEELYMLVAFGDGNEDESGPDESGSKGKEKEKDEDDDHDDGGKED